jgi:hypothetical protein
MIKETEDYSMFKKHPSNREFNEDNIRKIMKSMQIKNMLEYRPILVDKDFFIIDGQHRLEAAKRLKVPIWYQIETNSAPEDMYLLNANQKKWTLHDYLHFYCEQGCDDYRKLRDFLKKNQTEIMQSIRLLSKFKVKSHAQLGKLFMEGKFEFGASEEIKQAEELLEKNNTIIDYLLAKLGTNNVYLKTAKFMSALTDFFIQYPVEFETFMKKLPFRLDTIHPCSRKSQFITLLINIYNFRNQDPIVSNENIFK